MPELPERACNCPHKALRWGRNNMKTHNFPTFHPAWRLALGLLAWATLSEWSAAQAGSLDDLARPQEGRSMRATSTMRVGEVRRGRRNASSTPRPIRAATWRKRATGTTSASPPGETHVLLDEQGPGRHHAHLDHLPRPGAAGLGQARLGQPPGDAAAHVLGRQRAAGRRGAGGRFLRQLLRQAQRGHQPAGGRRGRRFLQLLLAHAVPQVGPDRDRQPERQADQPALLQHRLDQEGQAARGHALLLRPVPAGIPGRRRARTTWSSRRQGKGHYVGTVLAVRTRSPAWFGEGDEKIYIDGEAKPSIWGTGTEDYFLSAWGLKTDQHALLRRAVFRPVGHRRRPHQRLPLARQRSDRLQQGHQGHARALRLDLAGREPELQGHELERARGRLRQRGVLVSDGRADVHGPRPARPRAHAAQPGAGDRLRPRLRRRPAPRRGRARDRSSSTSIDGPATALHAQAGRRRLAGDSLRGASRRSRCGCC